MLIRLQKLKWLITSHTLEDGKNQNFSTAGEAVKGCSTLKSALPISDEVNDVHIIWPSFFTDRYHNKEKSGSVQNIHEDRVNQSCEVHSNSERLWHCWNKWTKFLCTNVIKSKTTLNKKHQLWTLLMLVLRTQKAIPHIVYEFTNKKFKNMGGEERREQNWDLLCTCTKSPQGI